jgi:hypothetical protein
MILVLLGVLSPFPPSVGHDQFLVMPGARYSVNCARCWACTVIFGDRTRCAALARHEPCEGFSWFGLQVGWNSPRDLPTDFSRPRPYVIARPSLSSS